MSATKLEDTRANTTESTTPGGADPFAEMSAPEVDQETLNEQVSLGDTRQQMQSLRQSADPDDFREETRSVLDATAAAERAAIVSEALEDGVVTSEEADVIQDSLREKDTGLNGTRVETDDPLSSAAGMFRKPEMERTLERNTDFDNLDQDELRSGASRLGAILNFNKQDSEQILDRSNDNLDRQREEAALTAQPAQDPNQIRFRVGGVPGTYEIEGRLENGMFTGAVVYPGNQADYDSLIDGRIAELQLAPDLTENRTDQSRTELRLDSDSFNGLGQRLELESSQAA